MPESLLNRYGPWAVVAGASEGLGEAFARHLAEGGLNLVLVARREAMLQTLADDLAGRYSIEARPIACDLASPGAGEQIEKKTADLDVGLLVYNAAFSLIGPFLGDSLDDHLKEVDVNVRAPLSLAYRFGERMSRQGRGGIVLLSSMAGFQGSPLIANYAATKAYNLVLGEGLWDELRPHGVDVLACCAGATRTPNYERSNPATGGPSLVPVQEPEAVAREALAALGKRPSIVTGKTNRVASFLLHRLLSRKRAVRIMGNNTRSLYGKDRS